MNVAYFLKPKGNVSFLYEDFTLRQGLEKIRRSGFTALPVITRENKYIGTASEGDFLWYLVQQQGEGELRQIPIRDTEGVVIKDVLRIDKNPPVRITASIEQLLTRAMNQNFIPVIDDREVFIGIVTRTDIIRHFYENSLELEKQT